MAIVVAEKIIEMFFIMLCGIVLFKTGLIDDKTVPKLSNILLMLVSPLMIFQSYQMDFDGHLMWGLGLTLIAALTTFTVIDCLLAASDFDLTCFKLGYTPFSTLSDLHLFSYKYVL